MPERFSSETFAIHLDNVWHYMQAKILFLVNLRLENVTKFTNLSLDLPVFSFNSFWTIYLFLLNEQKFLQIEFLDLLCMMYHLRFLNCLR